MNSNRIFKFITHFGRVTKEFLVTLFMSMIPIIMGAVAITAFSDSNILASLSKQFNYGEIFLYTSAFLSPYLINRKKNKLKNGSGTFCFYSFLFSFIFGAIMFTLIRTANIANIPLKLTSDCIFYCNTLIIITTTFTWYLSSWVNHYPAIDLNNTLKEQQNFLSNNFDNKLG